MALLTLDKKNISPISLLLLVEAEHQSNGGIRYACEKCHGSFCLCNWFTPF